LLGALQGARAAGIELGLLPVETAVLDTLPLELSGDPQRDWAQFGDAYDVLLKKVGARTDLEGVGRAAARGMLKALPDPLTEYLDLDAMRAAARFLEGRHDFAAFQASGGSAQTTEREVFTLRIAASRARSDRGDDCGSPIGDAGPVAQSAVRTPHGAMLLFDIRGSGFLRHMVRIIVGSLVEVGRGRQPIDWIGRVLASRDRTAAGPTAPGLGLFLVSVDYGSALAALS
jgi:tRNA U38,U39,U40 pseudouridine synthase TruA